MGDAKRKAEQLDDRETFEHGFMTVKVNGRPLLVELDRDGKVYQVQRGGRIQHNGIVEACHEIARKNGKSSRKIITESGLILPGK